MTTVAEDWATPFENVATMLVPKKSEAASPCIYNGVKIFLSSGEGIGRHDYGLEKGMWNIRTQSEGYRMDLIA